MFSVLSLEIFAALRLIEVFWSYAPQLFRSNAWRKPTSKTLAVDQPFRLRVGANKRCRQEQVIHGAHPPKTRTITPGEARPDLRNYRGEGALA